MDENLRQEVEDVALLHLREARVRVVLRLLPAALPLLLLGVVAAMIAVGVAATAIWAQQHTHQNVKHLYQQKPFVVEIKGGLVARTARRRPEEINSASLGCETALSSSSL